MEQVRFQEICFEIYNVLGRFKPSDLVGTNGYEDGIEKYNFCWRWYNNYRVLTLE